VRGKVKGDVRGMFFTQRVVGAWNSLPGEVVEADTIVTFKGRLDKYMNRMGIEGYGLRKGRGFFFRWTAWSVRLGGPKGLFLCCNFLCSVNQEVMSVWQPANPPWSKGRPTMKGR